MPFREKVVAEKTFILIKMILQVQYFTALSLFLFLSSCDGQEKPKLPEIPPKTNGVFPPEQIAKLDTSAQISEYVVEVFEDTKGNLWFGTMSDGAVRFDGKTLTYFSVKDGLCDNTVASIAEDHEGNIWFGTHNGRPGLMGKFLPILEEGSCMAPVAKYS